MITLPDLYFRVRDNGAVVFRLDTANRDRRIEMVQIAVVNTNRGDFKPHGDTVLTADESQAIATWLAARLGILVARKADDIQRMIDDMQMTAHWAQSKASEAELDKVTDKLLLAMHDLRSVLVRRKADRMTQDAGMDGRE